MGKNKKADIEYPFEHGEVINYRRPSKLSCRRERKPLIDFTMRPMVTLKQLQLLMAVIGENWGRLNNIVVTPNTNNDSEKKEAFTK